MKGNRMAVIRDGDVEIRAEWKWKSNEKRSVEMERLRIERIWSR